jgi:hypothetical protein
MLLVKYPRYTHILGISQGICGKTPEKNARGNNIPAINMPRKNIKRYWKNIPILKMKNIQGKVYKGTGSSILTLRIGKIGLSQGIGKISSGKMRLSSFCRNGLLRYRTR